MQLHKIVENTLVEGPGLRTCVFLQGCSLKCPGCFNTAMHDFDGGESVSIFHIVAKIARNEDITGVTIAGGEPLDQVHELTQLLQQIRFTCPHLNIILYSGYSYEMISFNRELLNCAKLSDVLICGKFDINMTPDPRKWIGSRNQDTIFFSERLREELTPWPKEDNAIELHIKKDEITLVGKGLGCARI